MKQKIILVGYMGSGKTTVGQNLGLKCNYNFVDLDAYIVKKEKKSIPELFDQKGAIYFRKIENEALLELLDVPENTIISLGGGTPCYYDHMELLNAMEHVVTIYLNVSIPVLAERLTHEMSQRPLISAIKSKEELTEFIGKHLFERRPYYNLAQIKIDINASDKAVDVISQEIVATLFQ